MDVTDDEDGVRVQLERLRSTLGDAVPRALVGIVYGYRLAKFAGHLPHRYGNSRAIWDHTPSRGDIPAFTPAEAGTRLSDPGGMQG